MSLREKIISGIVNPETAKNGEIDLKHGKKNSNPIMHVILYDFACSLNITPYIKIGNLPRMHSYHHDTL